MKVHGPWDMIRFVDTEIEAITFNALYHLDIYRPLWKAESITHDGKPDHGLPADYTVHTKSGFVQNATVTWNEKEIACMFSFDFVVGDNAIIKYTNPDHLTPNWDEYPLVPGSPLYNEGT